MIDRWEQINIGEDLEIIRRDAMKHKHTLAGTQEALCRASGVLVTLRPCQLRAQKMAI
jgi:hypothetical protein